MISGKRMCPEYHKRDEADGANISGCLIESHQHARTERPAEHHHYSQNVVTTRQSAGKYSESAEYAGGNHPFSTKDVRIPAVCEGDIQRAAGGDKATPPKSKKGSDKERNCHEAAVFRRPVQGAIFSPSQRMRLL